ncbi:UNKNOWN [Stylonychia lemnae]|uniref:Uncharacterized protein n=1 Tax=Stylonychia lemnae TaxID=5949 RepID=A0A077ZTX7_STYLE|nr:UNKNOWN [Stylonychia lemnae]|eukprot:CDW73029.1 UNKNOWN [Stylonychia lemnae]
MTFDDEPGFRGWKSIYLGLYSPFSNKYTSFMNQAIKKAKENSPVKMREPNYQGLGQSTSLPSFITLYQIGSAFTENSMVRSDNPTSRNNKDSEQLTNTQWQEQQEFQYISMFEQLSRYKRDVIESQIRNGQQSFMAQKYLQLVQQKKLRRTLQDIFRVAGKKRFLRNDYKYLNIGSSSKENLTVQSGISNDLQQDKLLKDSKNLSLIDFNYTDLRWPSIVKNKKTHVEYLRENSRVVEGEIRNRTAQAKIDIKPRQSFFMSSQLVMNRRRNSVLKSQEQQLKMKSKQIIRRKSCECGLCGGETKKVPYAALFEEESDVEEDRELFSSGISLQLKTNGAGRKAQSLFKNLKSMIQKSPRVRQNMLRNRQSKDSHLEGFQQANQSLKDTLEQEKLRQHQQNTEKLIIKYRPTRQMGGLSPIFDCEKQSKKKVGLNMKLIKQAFNSNDSRKMIRKDTQDSNIDLSPAKSSISQSPDQTSKFMKLKECQPDGFTHQIQQKIKVMKLTHNPFQKSRNNQFHTQFQTYQNNDDNHNHFQTEDHQPDSFNKESYKNKFLYQQTIFHKNQTRFLERVETFKQEYKNSFGKIERDQGKIQNLKSKIVQSHSLLPLIEGNPNKKLKKISIEKRSPDQKKKGKSKSRKRATTIDKNNVYYSKLSQQVK